MTEITGYTHASLGEVALRIGMLPERFRRLRRQHGFGPKFEPKRFNGMLVVERQEFKRWLLEYRNVDLATGPERFKIIAQCESDAAPPLSPATKAKLRALLGCNVPATMPGKVPPQ